MAPGDVMDVAFLHGGAQGGWVWRETIAAMRALPACAAMRALALDVPGCGTRRGQNTHDLAVDDIVDVLLDDIRAAGLSGVVLVGHSQAGSLMPLLAARSPELFRRLVYVTCSLPLPGQTVIQMMGGSVHGACDDEVGWPADPATTPASEMARLMLCNDMDSDSADAFMARLGGDAWPGASYDFTGWPPASPAATPASYIVCLRDNILPVPWQERFAQRFGAQQVLHIDAGHQVMNSRPGELAAMLCAEATLDART